MKTHLISALLLLFGFHPTPTSADDLSVMSFNIRFGSAKDGENSWPLRKDLVAEKISRFSPDLLGLQESVDFQVDYLAAELPDYEVYSVPRTPDGGESCAIFFRKERFTKLDEGTFWLSETPEVVASKSWDSSLPRIVSWIRLEEKATGKSFVFANTHFDHKGELAREESARLIRAKLPEIAGEAPFVLTGDFNCVDGSPPQLALVGEGSPFIDTYRRLNPEVVPAEEGTFTGFQESDDGRRIDWILSSAGFLIQSAEIDRYRKEGRLPSDHYPVTAVLRLSE